jgi:TonB family protein
MSATTPMFSALDEVQAKKNWLSFVASYAVQAIGVAILLMYTILSPHISVPVSSRIMLAAPDLLAPKPFEPIKPVAKAVKLPPAPAAVLIEAPKLETPQELVVRQPERVVRVKPVAEIEQPQAPRIDSKLLNSLPTSKALPKVIATNTFGSSAAPTLAKVAPSQVQTGGFGDPNGVTPSKNGSGKSMLAAAGMFDLPSGPGYGNGSGGAHGARGTVASAGFGNGIAVQPGAKQGHAQVQATSFNSAPAPAEERRPRTISDQPLSAPVSIQSKPTPVYTAEARQLRIEGEVLLNVVFTAQGKIQIVNVVRGLGHGLDEAAVRAAQGVKFTPAMRDGRPVDSNATLHIVFQLS